MPQLHFELSNIVIEFDAKVILLIINKISFFFFEIFKLRF